jgi:two-component system, cell cycle response regulator CpdR
VIRERSTQPKRFTPRLGFIAGLHIGGYSRRLRHPELLSAMPQSDVTRILLAEDDDSLRGFLARALEKAGYEVTACPDGETALDALDQVFDVLLTDIVMPGIDGIEVARQAATRQPHLRIMFITGFAAVALSAGDRAPAGAKVLSKPVHLREIVAEVERMIAA